MIHDARALILFFPLFLISLCGNASYAADILKLDAATSKWIESAKVLHQNVLRAGKYDVLVVPAQSTGDGFDIVGRSLMTRYLDMRLRDSGIGAIPDPTLVELALGSNARAYADESVYVLANELGVKTVIRTYAQHNKRKQAQFEFSAQVRGTGPISGNTPKSVYVRDAVWFDDEHPPEDRFLEVVDDAIAKILGKAVPAQKHRPANAFHGLAVLDSLDSKKLPAALDELGQAQYLQLLGLLTSPTGNRALERPLEKSLVLLARIPAGAPNAAVVKARSLFYLHRRPAAMLVIQGDDSPEANALRAYMNGNLPGLTEWVPKISDPLLKLIAQIELNTLHYEYRGYFDQNNPVDTKALTPELRYFVERRTAAPDPWVIDSNLRIKAILDAVFPISGFTAEALVKGGVAGPGFDLRTDIVTSVAEHVMRLLRENPSAWCCAPSPDAPTKLDYLQFLESLGEDNILRELTKRTYVYGLPDDALELLDQIDFIYAGHPEITAKREQALSQSSGKHAGIKKQQLTTEASALRIPLFTWLGGQTREATRYRNFAWQELWNQLKAVPQDERTKALDANEFMLYDSDFPSRVYWVWSKAGNEEKIKYASTEFHVAEALYDERVSKARYRDHATTGFDPDTMLRDLTDRFIGHPKRLQFLVKLKRVAGDDAGATALLRNAVAEKDTDRFPYEQLAKVLVEQGSYSDAAEAFLRYPMISDVKGDNEVSISNTTNKVGSYFYWHGAVDEARRIYEISSRAGTGSGGDFSSRQRLALMDGDYLAAVYYSLQRGQRYQSTYGLRDYMSLLHVLGDHDKAWSTFDVLLDKLPSVHYWEAAFIGHRVQRAGDDTIIQWLSRPHLKNFQNNADDVAKYAFMQFTNDRAPNANVEAALQALYDNKPNYTWKKWMGNARLYDALKRRDFAHAVDNDNKLPEFSGMISTDAATWLPYYAWAAVKTSDVERGKVENVLEKLNKQLDAEREREGARNLGLLYDYHLAQAFLAGGLKKFDDSIAHIRKAFGYRPHIENRPFFTWQQVVEACEWLYEDSQHEAYRELALELSLPHQVVQPMFAWAFAVEANYSQDPEKRKRALGMALYLDEKSAHLAHFTENDKDSAREWFKRNNPFDIEKLKRRRRPQEG